MLEIISNKTKHGFYELLFFYSAVGVLVSWLIQLNSQVVTVNYKNNWFTFNLPTNYYNIGYCIKYVKSANLWK